MGTESSEYNNGATPLPSAALSSVNVRAVNYGPLGFDHTNSFNLDVVYNLPNVGAKGSFLDNVVARQLLGGWQISAIAGYAGGAPQIATYAITGVGQTTLNQEITGSADIAPRGVLTCNPTTSGPKTSAQWIDISCIQPAQKGSIGADSGPGAFRGLGYRNWDASIMKRFALGGIHTATCRFASKPTTPSITRNGRASI